MADMPTIAELEARIASALGRIGQGLDRLPFAGTDPAEQTALQEALEAERTASAQLSERLRLVKEREATTRAAMEAQVAALTETRDQQGAELQRLHQTIAELRQDGVEGAAAPQADNGHLMAELQTLRAERRGESAEIQAILSALAPLIEETPNHA